MISLALAAALMAQPTDCRDPQDQTSMNICAAQAYRAADADLNRVWAQALARVQRLDRESAHGEAERRLRAAQRAWLAFRDAQCQVAGLDALGGSMEPLLVGGCLRDLTERRTNELHMLLQEQ